MSSRSSVAAGLPALLRRIADGGRHRQPMSGFSLTPEAVGAGTRPSKQCATGAPTAVAKDRDGRLYGSDTVESSYGWGPRLGSRGIGRPTLPYRCNRRLPVRAALAAI